MWPWPRQPPLGARRQRFLPILAASHASDLQFQFYSSQSVASLEYLTKELQHLPQVTRVAIAPTLLIVPLGANGKALPNGISSDEIQTIGSMSGELLHPGSGGCEAGRMANPKSAREMVATAGDGEAGGLASR